MRPLFKVLWSIFITKVQSQENSGPYSYGYPYLECGQTVTGILGVYSSHWYQVNVTKPTIFYGTFDTCHPKTNFSTILTIFGWSVSGWKSIHEESDYSLCSSTGGYTTMQYNITSYPDNGIINNDTFIFAIRTNPSGFNFFSNGIYQASLTCGGSTLSTQHPSTSRPTTSPINSTSTNTTQHQAGSAMLPIIFFIAPCIFCCVAYFKNKDDSIKQKHSAQDNDTVLQPEDADTAKDGIGCIEGCKDSPHVMSWILTLLIWLLIYIKINCILHSDKYCYCEYCNGYNVDCEYDGCLWKYVECRSPCDFAYSAGAWWICAFIFYFIVYWCEIYFSSTTAYLLGLYKRSNKGESASEYIERMKCSAPSIWWKVECYHYKVTKETLTITDKSSGRSRTTTENKKTERIVTHSAKQYYERKSWSDLSKPMIGLDAYKLTKIEFHKKFVFANNYTEQDYNEQLRRFKSMNFKDVQNDFSSGMDIEDYTEKMIAEVQPGARPCFLHLGWFLIASLLFMSPLYRMWFAAIVGRKRHHTFIKCIEAY